MIRLRALRLDVARFPRRVPRSLGINLGDYSAVSEIKPERRDSGGGHIVVQPVTTKYWAISSLYLKEVERRRVGDCWIGGGEFILWETRGRFGSMLIS